MENFRGRAAVVGIGEVPTGRYPDRQPLDIAVEVCKQAIEDAGIQKDEVDVIMPTMAVGNVTFSGAMGFDLLVEELGLNSKAKMNLQIFAGGASSAAMLKTAVSMVCSGMANNILCVHADTWSQFTSQGIIDQINFAGPVSTEWEIPYGCSLATQVACLTQRYMHETGTTPEQAASVCVALRKWAELNPNAMFRKPLTVEEVLNSKLVVTPFHGKEVAPWVDGGAAFIVTSADRAKTICPTPVYVLGFGSVVVHYSLSQEFDVTTLGYPQAAKEAYRMAGIGPKDIDIAEIYDGIPVVPLIALEGLGICARGEAGQFVAEGHTWPGGDLPMTTNGGMLSQGHTAAGGGVAILVEAVRQLMGKAGQRQVKDAKIAVETATSGTYNDAHVTILGREIP